MPLLTHGMDTMDVDGEVITDTPTGDIPDTMDTVPTDTDMVLDTTDTDGVDITDTPTPGLTVITTLERDLLRPNLRLRPHLRLMPNPGTMAVGVDTMAILIEVITVMDTAVVT